MSSKDRKFPISFEELLKLQRVLRLKLLGLHIKANSGHIGCSLSCIDLMISTLIYNKSEDDTFILSKGHAATALYTCFNYLGEINDQELESFYKDGTTLPAHPPANKFPGIPFATGSLGHGLPVGAGIAKANKMKNKQSFVYVLVSDGETNEGTTWEAAHFARQHKLDNLIVTVDRNKIQGFGYSDEVLGNTTTIEMWESLGFNAVEIDGHDLETINGQLAAFKNDKNGQPKVIIANTIKGKGVSYMENQLDWHYWPMDEDLYKRAVRDVNKVYGNK